MIFHVFEIVKQRTHWLVAQIFLKIYEESSTGYEYFLKKTEPVSCSPKGTYHTPSSMVESCKPTLHSNKRGEIVQRAMVGRQSEEFL